MSHNSRDELSAFDELNESGSHSEPAWEPLDRPAQEQTDPAPRRRRVIVGIVVLAVVALAVWQWFPREDDSSQPATATSTETTALPTTTTAASPTPDAVDGYGPQAAEERSEPTSGVVAIAAPTNPKVNTKDPESVMTAFLTALNNREENGELDQVQGWTADYVALDSLDPIDPYTDNGPMGGKAPTQTRDVELEKVKSAKPADSSTHRTREAKVTVQSHTGTETIQTWTVKAMKDGETWKVIEATLESWTGKTD